MTRLARTADGTPLVGDDDGFVPLSSADSSFDRVVDALPAAAAGDLNVADAPATPRPADALSFARPLESLGKLWGIGLNYVDHADDLDEDTPDQPGSFLKPATAATGPGGPIVLPPTDLTDRVTAEAELAVVIGRTCRNVSVDEVDDVVAGYVPVVDMTAEDVLEKNPRYLTRAKSFDSFLVFGPWLVTTDEVPSLADVTVRTVVNGETAAENSVANMTHPPRELVAFHSEVMTLEPGDVISTGTPGAKPISPGDTARAVVEGVGSVEADVVR